MKKIKKIIGLALIGGLVIGNSVVANASTVVVNFQNHTNPKKHAMWTAVDYNNKDYYHSAVIRYQSDYASRYQYNVDPPKPKKVNSHNESVTNYPYVATYGQYYN